MFGQCTLDFNVLEPPCQLCFNDLYRLQRLICVLKTWRAGQCGDATLTGPMGRVDAVVAKIVMELANPSK